MDCVGLLLCAAHNLQLTDYDNVNYNRIVNTERLRVEIEQFYEPIELVGDTTLRPGDVLLFEINGSPQHVGMVTEVSDMHTVYFIHAHEGVGKVVEHRLILNMERTAGTSVPMARAFSGLKRAGGIR